MPREISLAYRYETAEIDKRIDDKKILMGWLAANATSQSEATPQTTRTDTDGIISLAEKFLPLPDKIAINTINQVTEEVHIATEIVDGIGVGDVQSATKSAANLIKPALKSDSSSINAAEDQIFPHEQQLILDEIEKIFTRNDSSTLRKSGITRVA